MTEQTKTPDQTAREYERLGRIHGLLEADYGTLFLDCKIDILYDGKIPISLSGHFTFYKTQDKSDKDRAVYCFQGHHKQPDQSQQRLELVTDKKWQHLQTEHSTHPFLYSRAYNLGHCTGIRISALEEK